MDALAGSSLGPHWRVWRNGTLCTLRQPVRHEVVTYVIGTFRYLCVRVRQLKTLATPAGLEPATNSLEGPWSRNDFNARSDIFTVRAPFDALQNFVLSERPHLGLLPPPNARRRRVRRTRRLSGGDRTCCFRSTFETHTRTKRERLRWM